jgi:hypothetical protein
VIKDGFITLIQNQNYKTWNGITQHHSRKEEGEEKTKKKGKKRQKIPKTNPPASKITVTISLEAEGCILVGFLPHGKTFNAAAACRYSRGFVMHS